MGCDIHLFVEHLQDGKWVSCDKWKEEDGEVHVDFRESFYHDRNYDLFSILADVRNGVGFAGVPTGTGFTPIAQPRGLPHDASPQVRALSDRWSGDGHSHSWHTLEQLLQFDWTQVTTKQGWVNGVEYWEWQQRAKWAPSEGPENYCGGVSGRDIVHLSEEDMKSKLALIPKGFSYGEQRKDIIKALGNHYCPVSWKSLYYMCCRKFWSDTIPRLLRLGAPHEVRIVFWFDN